MWQPLIDAYQITLGVLLAFVTIVGLISLAAPLRVLFVYIWAVIKALRPSSGE